MDPVVIAMAVVVVVPLIVFVWKRQRKQIGIVRCKRCHHVGPPKGLWAPFRGLKPVCQKCGGEDWVVVGAAPQAFRDHRVRAIKPSSSKEIVLVINAPTRLEAMQKAANEGWIVPELSPEQTPRRGHADPPA